MFAAWLLLIRRKIAVFLGLLANWSSGWEQCAGIAITEATSVRIQMLSQVLTCALTNRACNIFRRVPMGVRMALLLVVGPVLLL